MATYNGAAFVEAQLESLLSQTLQPDELVVGDDGSDDATCDIVERFSLDAPFPVRLIRNQDRLGYIDNFLNLTRKCRSDLIAFCDQDDIWYPTKLARCVACFSAEDVMLVHHQADLIDQFDHIVGTLIHHQDRFGYGGRRPFALAPGFTEMFRASLLPKRAWSDAVTVSDQLLPMGHDKLVYFFAVMLGEVAYINDPLAGYRQHGANAVGANPRRSGIGWIVSQWSQEAEYWKDVSNYLPTALAILTTELSQSKPDRVAWVERRTRIFKELQVITPLRERLYTDQNLRNRLSAVFHLVRTRTYRKQLGFDQSVIRDLICALLGPNTIATVRTIFRRFSPV